MKIVAFFQLWWKVKKFNRGMIKLAKTTTLEPEIYSVDGVRAWKDANWFGITDEELNARCMSSVPPRRVANVFKEIG